MIFNNITEFFKNNILILNSISKNIKLDQLKNFNTPTSVPNYSDSESLLKKWVYSTNHKYIGILYLIFGLLMGIVGATFSLMIRLELLSPGHVFF